MIVVPGPRTCFCRCHQEARANYDAAVDRHELARQEYDANPISPWTYRRLSQATADVRFYENVDTVNVVVSADTDDVIEAAAACPCCLNEHVAALVPRLIWGPRIKPKAELPPYVDQGEGAE